MRRDGNDRGQGQRLRREWLMPKRKHLGPTEGRTETQGKVEREMLANLDAHRTSEQTVECQRKRIAAKLIRTAASSTPTLLYSEKQYDDT